MELHEKLKQEKFKRYEEKHRNRRKWLKIAVSLCLVVAIITSYLLINPANTQVAKTYCGYEEHTHTGECYGFEGMLKCEIEEHEHTLQCFSNPDADKEDAFVWEASLTRADLTGVPNSDVLAIARTQLGYSESSRNYEVQGDGTSVNGYTRYGDWYGDAYGDWNTMFAAFCVDQAGVGMPLASSAQTWVDELSDPFVGLYYPLDNGEDAYSPESGDIVFFDVDKDSTADRTGVVAEVIRDTKTDEIIRLNTIEGDCAGKGNNQNSVQYASYSIDDETIMGFGSVQQAGSADTTAIMPLMLGASNPSSGVLVVSASDFQDPSTSHGNLTTQTQRVKNILTQIKNEYGNAYGFLSGGDYNWGTDNADGSKAGLDAVKSGVADIMGNDVHMVFTQGNHDPSSTGGLSATGAHDTDYYGVYCIREDDYPQYGGNKASVQTVADNLGAYLKAKADAGYDKPVFIVTHLPLHYSTRCYKEGDAKYASLLFDAIAEYGDELNIFFLYGHDHANGNDNYLGGAAVFLTRGDSIFIAEEGNQTKYTSRTLNFTYMNCGFAGYYVDQYGSLLKSNADDTLTMAAFYIEGNKVTVSRWTVNGQYTYLKAKGVNATSSAGHGADKWSADTKEYTGSIKILIL